MSRTRTTYPGNSCSAAATYSAWNESSCSCPAGQTWNGSACLGTGNYVSLGCNAGTQHYNQTCNKFAELADITCGPGERTERNDEFAVCPTASNNNAFSQRVRCVADASCNAGPSLCRTGRTENPQECNGFPYAQNGNTLIMVSTDGGVTESGYLRTTLPGSPTGQCDGFSVTYDAAAASYPMCGACPSGQTWNGSSCVLPAPTCSAGWGEPELVYDGWVNSADTWCSNTGYGTCRGGTGSTIASTAGNVNLCCFGEDHLGYLRRCGSASPPSSCGSAHQQTASSAPSGSNLCGTGNTPSAVTKDAVTGDWVWTCKAGSRVAVNCNAPSATPACSNNPVPTAAECGCSLIGSYEGITNWHFDANGPANSHTPGFYCTGSHKVYDDPPWIETVWVGCRSWTPCAAPSCEQANVIETLNCSGGRSGTMTRTRTDYPGNSCSASAVYSAWDESACTCPANQVWTGSACEPIANCGSASGQKFYADTPPGGGALCNEGTASEVSGNFSWSCKSGTQDAISCGASEKCRITSESQTKDCQLAGYLPKPNGIVRTRTVNVDEVCGTHGPWSTWDESSCRFPYTVQTAPDAECPTKPYSRPDLMDAFGPRHLENVLETSNVECVKDFITTPACDAIERRIIKPNPIADDAQRQLESCVKDTSCMPRVDAKCGSASGSVVTSAPSSGLCDKGDATAVTGTGPWKWSCSVKNTATTVAGKAAACEAQVAPPTVVKKGGICEAP